MAGYKYAIKNYNKENMARVVGLDLPISVKHSIEICNFIRKMELQKAKAFLNDVMTQKRAVPFKRFNNDVGHRRGKIGPGRYPLKASTEILNLLNSIESNAQFKGLSTGNLVISHICPNKASTPLHQGRQRSREMKRTHVEIVVEERAKESRAKIKTQTAIEEKAKVKPTEAVKSHEEKAKVKPTEAKEIVKEEKAPETKIEKKEAEAKQDNTKSKSVESVTKSKDSEREEKK